MTKSYKVCRETKYFSYSNKIQLLFYISFIIYYIILIRLLLHPAKTWTSGIHTPPPLKYTCSLFPRLPPLQNLKKHVPIFRNLPFTSWIMKFSVLPCCAIFDILFTSLKSHTFTSLHKYELNNS